MVSSVFGEQPSAAKWNQLGENDAGFKDGTNIEDDAVKSRHIDWADTGGGDEGGIWWEEIGRTTLGSAGDTISVASLPVRKYLRIIVKTIASGTINNILRFNNDSGNNYSYRRSENFAAASTATSVALIDIGGTASAANRFSVTDVINIAAQTKTAIGNVVETNGAASAAPISGEHFAKWVNTADSITRVDVLNTQAGDFAIGSEVVILGHD